MVAHTLDNRAEGVAGGALGERVLVLTVGHGFGTDEDQVEGDAREHIGELVPDVAGERGFGAGAEDEETDGGRRGADVFDFGTTAGEGRMQGISERYG